MNHDFAATLLRVSNGSRPTALAGAIAGQIRHHQSAELSAIGAGAVNQAIKAIAVAQNYLQLDGIDISFKCEFQTHTVEGQERTLMHFNVKAQ